MREEIPGLSLIERLKHEGKESREPRFGPVWIDKADWRTLRLDGSSNVVKLFPKEAEMLWLFMSVQGGVIQRSDIEQWFQRDLPDHVDISLLKNTSEMQALYNLRNKLEKLTNGRVSIQALGRTPRNGKHGYYLEINE